MTQTGISGGAHPGSGSVIMRTFSHGNDLITIQSQQASQRRIAWLGT